MARSALTPQSGWVSWHRRPRSPGQYRGASDSMTDHGRQRRPPRSLIAPAVLVLLSLVLFVGVRVTPTEGELPPEADPTKHQSIIVPTAVAGSAEEQPSRQETVVVVRHPSVDQPVRLTIVDDSARVLSARSATPQEQEGHSHTRETSAYAAQTEARPSCSPSGVGPSAIARPRCTSPRGWSRST